MTLEEALAVFCAYNSADWEHQPAEVRSAFDEAVNKLSVEAEHVIARFRRTRAESHQKGCLCDLCYERMSLDERAAIPKVKVP